MADRSSVKVENKQLVIRVPIKGLTEMQLNRFPPFKITDEKAMVVWLFENILEWENDEFSDTGFNEFINLTFENAFGEGERWLTGIVKETKNLEEREGE